MSEVVYTPTEYFEHVKSLKHTITDEVLASSYENALKLATKYKKMGQVDALKKLMFHTQNTQCIEAEREIVKAGIDTFVYREDIEEFIKNVDSKVVKIIELSRYEREVPDDVTEAYEKVSHLFSEFYVLFTDYTGEMEKKVEKERRDKDPILFGAFKDSKINTVIDRFYYIGNWVDEYCDLTLDRMVTEAKSITGIKIDHQLSTPEGIEELRGQLNNLRHHEEGHYLIHEQLKSQPEVEGKKLIFSKVKTFLKAD